MTLAMIMAETIPTTAPIIVAISINAVRDMPNTGLMSVTMNGIVGLLPM